MSLDWKTEADEQRERDLEDEIEENKLDPWCYCGWQMSDRRHFPPTMTHYFNWDPQRNKCEAPEGGN